MSSPTHDHKTAQPRITLSARNRDIKAKLSLIRQLLDEISPPRS